MQSIRCVLRAATGIACIAATLSGCARVEEGEIARNELVSLMVVGVKGVRTLRLDAAPGAQINALLPPTVEFSPTERLQLSSPLVTADSSYFTASPSVRERADKLRQEMIKRRLQHSPINWPS